MKTATRVTTVLAVLLLCGTVGAETRVTVTSMHLCCRACIKSVRQAVTKIEGAKVAIQADKKSVIISGGDELTVKGAIKALADAGFHGQTDHDKLKFPNDSKIKKGKVKRLALEGVHNCCGGCNTSIKKALSSVPGVKASSAKPRSTQMVVEGEFDGLALIKALNKAGFHVVKQGSRKKPVPKE